jgi:hypothetical protein
MSQSFCRFQPTTSAKDLLKPRFRRMATRNSAAYRQCSEAKVRFRSRHWLEGFDLPLAIIMLQAAGVLPDLPENLKGDFILVGEVVTICSCCFHYTRSGNPGKHGGNGQNKIFRGVSGGSAEFGAGADLAENPDKVLDWFEKRR